MAAFIEITEDSGVRSLINLDQIRMMTTTDLGARRYTRISFNSGSVNSVLAKESMEEIKAKIRARLIEVKAA